MLPPIMKRSAPPEIVAQRRGKPLAFCLYTDLISKRPMPSFRVVTTDQVPEVLGEFPNLAYADMFVEALMHQSCQRSNVEHWDGREWVAL